MHVFDEIAAVVVLVMVGVEFAVSAFVNPSAWRLAPEPQAKMLSHFAASARQVMPVWYAAGLLLLVAEMWLHRAGPGRGLLLAASAIWLLTTLSTLVFLVPLNNLVIKAGPGWQEAHRTWDTRHRVRIVALAVAAVLLAYVVTR